MAFPRARPDRRHPPPSGSLHRNRRRRHPHSTARRHNSLPDSRRRHRTHLPPWAHVHSRRQRLGQADRWSLIAWLTGRTACSRPAVHVRALGGPRSVLAPAWMPWPAWTGRWAGPTIWVRAREHQRAIHRLLIRFCASRRRDLRSRPDHRPRNGPQAQKAASKRFRGATGHTPLSIAEDIPWRCRRLVIGTGADGALPVMQQVREEARRRKVDLVILPTAEAIDVLAGARKDTNAVLHVTC